MGLSESRRGACKSMSYQLTERMAARRCAAVRRPFAVRAGLLRLRNNAVIATRVTLSVSASYGACDVIRGRGAAQAVFCVRCGSARATAGPARAVGCRMASARKHVLEAINVRGA